MYESLIAEYLDLPIPPYTQRDDIGLVIAPPKQNNIVQVIVGVRRCGKTYYLFQLMDQLIKSGIQSDLILHMSLDDDRLQPYTPDTLSQILDDYFSLVPAARKGCYLFLDEIQDVPNWESFIRRVSEQHPLYIILQL